MRRALPHLAAVLASGLLLGAASGALAWLRHQRVIPGGSVGWALWGAALLLGVLWMALLHPAALLLARLRPRGEEPARRVPAAALALAAASASWLPALSVLAPLAGSGALPAAAARGGAAAAALVAGLIAWRLPAPPRRLAAALGGLSAALCLAGLGPALGQAVALRGRASAPWPDEGPAPPPGAPDVVLLTVDTLRADHIGAFGGPDGLTPEIDRLAREGVVFQHAVAPAPWTLPSLAGLMTGLEPSEHGAGAVGPDPRRFARRTPVRAELTLLAERFAAAGWRTAAVVGNAWTSPYFGLDRGFARYDNPTVRSESLHVLEDLPLAALLVPLLPRAERGDDRGEAIVTTAERWLDEPADRPLFLWVHLIDPHAPYLADPGASEDNSMLVELGGGLDLSPDGRLVSEESFAAVQEVRAGNVQLDAEERRRIRTLYRAEVAYTDRCVGRLAEALRRRGRPVVLAFAADHGEEFWEHGGFEHAHDLHAEVVRVPMLLWGARVPRGLEVRGTVGLIDLGPTLLDLAGIEADLGRGRSLAGTWKAPGGRPLWSERNLYGLPAVLVAEGRWRLIERANGQVELYDVEADPAERTDLARERPDVVARLRALVEARGSGLEPARVGAGDAAAPALDAQTVQGLRALGYVQ